MKEYTINTDIILIAKNKEEAIDIIQAELSNIRIKKNFLITYYLGEIQEKEVSEI